MDLHYGEASLVIEVRNDRAPVSQASGKRPEGGGHGIIGMRERAAMLGGHLSAGPTGKGEFLVTAILPLDHDGPGDAA